MQIEIIAGDQVFELLSNPEFLAAYGTILNRCPWATAYQEVAFFRTWYETYSDLFEPWIVLGKIKGELRSALTLTKRKLDGEIFVAGTYHAEYQAWIAAPDDSDTFIIHTLRFLKHETGTSSLTFKYLPPGLALTWMEDARKAVDCDFTMRRHRRPLMDLGEHAERAKKKKSNKSRLSRLKRQGTVEVLQIKTIEQFRQKLPEIALQYDLRQGAQNGSCPFHDDPLKERFHCDLIAAKDSPMRAYVLTSGETVAAALIGFVTGRTLAVGILSFSEIVARHSPGKLLLIHVGEMLRAEGIDRIDLTPGDSWKDRFATTEDVVTELKVHFNFTTALREKLFEKATVLARSTVAVFGLSPTQIRDWVGQIRRVRLGKVVRAVCSAVWISREIRVYYMAKEKAKNLESSPIFSKDCFDALLAFEPVEPWQSRQNFLSDSLERIRLGCHLYTLVENGVLIHCGWLNPRQKTVFFSEVRQEHEFPNNTAVFFDFFTHPTARGRGLYRQSVQTMARDAVLVHEAEHVFISVLSDNDTYRHVIERVGFSCSHSLWWKRRFGRECKSRTR